MLERSAYVHFPPALYKLGHCYEFANPPKYVLLGVETKL